MTSTAEERRRGSVPPPLAVVSWLLAGVFLLGAAGLATSSLQEGLEISSPAIAIIAAGLLVIATELIVIATASPRSLRAPEPAAPRSATRVALGVGACAGLLVGAYVVFTAAPGGPGFSDSRVRSSPRRSGSGWG